MWREETASVMEQFATTMFAENLRLDPGITRRALADSDAEPEQIEELRTMLVQDMEMGDAAVQMPKNAMIKLFLDGSSGMSWIFFMFARYSGSFQRTTNAGTRWASGRVAGERCPQTRRSSST